MIRTDGRTSILERLHRRQGLFLSQVTTEGIETMDLAACPSWSGDDESMRLHSLYRHSERDEMMEEGGG